jgi:anti-sigma-K factor RskA
MSDASDMSDRDGLAAEYVLGTLPLAERLQAERLIASDADFAALVEGWQARLAPLNGGYAELVPPPGLLARIEARLYPAAERPARRWWPILGALAAAAAALVMALYFPGARPAPEITATLVGENQPLVVAAAWDADTQEVTFTRTGGPAAEAGKDYELWVIPAGQAAVSLGILRDQAVTVPLDALPAGTTLAITLEQTGGSPTGVAQGPLLVAAVIEG